MLHSFLSFFDDTLVSSKERREKGTARHPVHLYRNCSVLCLQHHQTGSTDENTVIPLQSLQKINDAIPDDVEKIMVRRKDAGHGNMLYCADGYVTAWFLYQLCGDEEAASVFTETGELSPNPLCKVS